MAGDKEGTRFSLLSNWELVSAWVNQGPGLDQAEERGLAAEFATRGLALPAGGKPVPPGPAKATKPPMSRETFLDYLFLIYTVTGIFYAWLYLPLRLIKGDFGRDRKHHFIQLAISLAYQGAEVGTYFLVEGLVP